MRNMTSKFYPKEMKQKILKSQPHENQRHMTEKKRT